MLCYRMKQSFFLDRSNILGYVLFLVSRSRRQSDLVRVYKTGCFNGNFFVSLFIGVYRCTAYLKESIGDFQQLPMNFMQKYVRTLRVL